MRITRTILVMCILAPATVSAALLPLLNPGFESGTDNWSQWGSGSYTANETTADARTGSQSLLVSVPPGGTGLRYQRVAATPGKRYTASAWAKHASNGTAGRLKIEFHASGESKLTEIPLDFTATSTWTQYEQTGIAPASTVTVTITCEANAGSDILFDDTAIDESDVADDAVTYDVSDTSHEFMGFGAHIWGYGNTPEYPDLLDFRQQALEELNIKYVRIENVAETATLANMQATRAVTDALGVEWVYMAWIAPGFMDGSGMLNDIPGFATWWKDEVDYLYTTGMPVEYIELMNEPDSMYLNPSNPWSTGISYSDYNTLVKDLRT
ncbi:MAG: carbohydrate binding domain-containing protein, partial [Planctomycetota bacterium]